MYSANSGDADQTPRFAASDLDDSQIQKDAVVIWDKFWLHCKCAN